jgi:hypothetical protein
MIGKEMRRYQRREENREGKRIDEMRGEEKR